MYDSIWLSAMWPRIVPNHASQLLSNTAALGKEVPEYSGDLCLVNSYSVCLQQFSGVTAAAEM